MHDATQKRTARRLRTEASQPRFFAVWVVFFPRWVFCVPMWFGSVAWLGLLRAYVVWLGRLVPGLYEGIQYTNSPLTSPSFSATSNGHQRKWYGHPRFTGTVDSHTATQ
jgi:hypothetical protein